MTNNPCKFCNSSTTVLNEIKLSSNNTSIYIKCHNKECPTNKFNLYSNIKLEYMYKTKGIFNDAYH